MDGAPPLPELSPEMLPVLDLLPDPVTLSRDGRILFANLAAVAATGAADRESLVGRTLQELVVPEERPIVGDRVQRQQAGQQLPAIEYRGLTLDGRRVTVEVHVRPILYAGAPGMLALVRDITARRRMEEDLRRAQKLEAVGQLAGGVAHDFNGLLLVISGYLDLLLGGAEDREALMREAQGATARAASIVRRLLAFSRMQRHRCEVLCPNEVVREFLPMLERVLGDGVDLQQDLRDGVPRVEADPCALEGALLNLVLNARDAGGRIGVETGTTEVEGGDELRPGHYATVTVWHDGDGPPGDTRGVAELLRRQGGGFTCTAQRATLLLPEAPPRVPEPAPPSTPAAETILIVDDEAGLRHMLARALSSQGYRVLEAASAEGALDLLDAAPVDLVLTDIVMPGMSGLDLARRILAERPGLPVVLMTGYAERLDEWEGPAPPVLVKPFRLAELEMLLREVLAAPPVRAS